MSKSFELKHPSFASFIAELQRRCMSEGFELKPCPFCGSTNVKIVVNHTNDDCGWYYSYYVLCRDCGARGAEKRDEEKPLAIRAWNHRADSAEQ